jgi:hypothetical protein
MSANDSAPKFETPVLVLVAFVVTLVLTGYVVLAAGGQGTAEFVALAAGPIITTVVGAVLGRRAVADHDQAVSEPERIRSMANHPAGKGGGQHAGGDPAAL